PGTARPRAARAERSPAEYSRKKSTGRFSMRSQTADWIVDDIRVCSRMVAMPCVSLKSDVDSAEATSAMPTPKSRLRSACGTATSNTWPVRYGVTVPNTPTTPAIEPTHRSARSDLQEIAHARRAFGERPVQRVAERGDVGRHCGVHRLPLAGRRVDHRVGFRALGQQRNRLLARRQLPEHRALIALVPVVAQR